MRPDDGLPARPDGAAHRRGAGRRRSSCRATPAATATCPSGCPVLREADRRRYAAAGVPTTRRADPDHLRCAARLHPGARRALRPGRPGADRMPDLSGGAGRGAGRRAGCPRRSGWPTRPEAARPQRRAWDHGSFRAPPSGRPRPRLGYLIPDFQNPTGALMDAATREAARRGGGAPAARCWWSTSRSVTCRSRGNRRCPRPSAHSTAMAPGPGWCRSARCPSRSGAGCASAGSRASAPLVQRLAAARALGDMAGPGSRAAGRDRAARRTGARADGPARPAGHRCRGAARRYRRVPPGLARGRIRAAAPRCGSGCPVRSPPTSRYWPRRPGSGSRPARGSARTARWSPTCGCPTRRGQTDCGRALPGWRASPGRAPTLVPRRCPAGSRSAKVITGGSSAPRPRPQGRCWS